jgi:hypothetical protein
MKTKAALVAKEQNLIIRQSRKQPGSILFVYYSNDPGNVLMNLHKKSVSREANAYIL